MSATSSATTKAAPLSEWSEKLPVWGTTSAGELSAHQTPDYLTAVRDGSQLLPTPTRWVQGEADLDKYLARREREKAKGRNGNGFGLPLDMAVKLLPTPQAWDGSRGPDNSRLQGDGKRPSGQQGTLNLAGAIQLVTTGSPGAATRTPSDDGKPSQE